MDFFATSVICYLTIVGTPIGANIIDDIFMSNWKSQEAKQNDPFFDPFGLTFPIFDVVNEDPMKAFLRGEDMEKRELHPERRDGKKVKQRKPWFSISEFLTLPVAPLKTKSEGRKVETGLLGGKTVETAASTVITTLQGDSTQKVSPFPGIEQAAEGSKVRRIRDVGGQSGRIFNELDFAVGVPDNLVVDMKKENLTAAKGKNESKFSIPRGISDILIVFQKVIPKPKSRIVIKSADHECDEFCRNGICKKIVTGTQGENDKRVTVNTEQTVEPNPSEIHSQPRHTKNGFVVQYDRICLLAIPIALVIGTILFIVELRRIFKKMKKQSSLSSFNPQKC